MSYMEYCCKSFEKSATSHAGKVGGGFLYPTAGHSSQFEGPDDDILTWSINGCCGSCYVVTDMLFCPYCGKELPKK